MAPHSRLGPGRCTAQRLPREHCTCDLGGNSSCAQLPAIRKLCYACCRWRSALAAHLLDCAVKQVWLPLLQIQDEKHFLPIAWLLPEGLCVMARPSDQRIASGSSLHVTTLMQVLVAGAAQDSGANWESAGAAGAPLAHRASGAARVHQQRPSSGACSRSPALGPVLPFMALLGGI